MCALGEFISEKGISLEPGTYDFKLDLYISAEENAEPVLVQSAQRNWRTRPEIFL